MLYCPECNIEYEDGIKFCKECGKKVVLREDTQKPHSEETEDTKKDKKYCPHCGAQYTADKKFCKDCGIQLTDKPQTASPKMDTATGVPRSATSASPSWFSVKSTLRKKKTLLRKQQKITMLITNLQRQKGAISDNSLNAIMGPYQSQLKIFEERLGEINDYLHRLLRDISAELKNLQTELSPYKTRLSELKAMRKAKGLTFRDYIGASKEPRRESRRISREIRKRQRLIRLLQESSTASINIGRLFNLSSKMTIGIGVIIIFVLSIYLGYNLFLKTDEEIETSAYEARVIQEGKPEVRATLPNDEIRKVLENIKQAHLTEDISLFMSCYSTSFPLYEKKRDNTISTWRDFDFVEVNYNLQDVIINQNTAKATVNWQIKALSADTGNKRTFNITKDVIFQKEAGGWKIINVK